jgi:hypothetical protein
VSAWLASVTSENVTSIYTWLGVLVLIIVVGGLGLWYYRRRWMKGGDIPSAPWTFDDLRQMRERGDVTEDEYQVLRANILGLAAPSEAKASRADAETDPSGDTVWSFDLKKSPPG